MRDLKRTLLGLTTLAAVTAMIACAPSERGAVENPNKPADPSLTELFNKNLGKVDNNAANQAFLEAIASITPQAKETSEKGSEEKEFTVSADVKLKDGQTLKTILMALDEKLEDKDLDPVLDMAAFKFEVAKVVDGKKAGAALNKDTSDEIKEANPNSKQNLGFQVLCNLNCSNIMVKLQFDLNQEKVAAQAEANPDQQQDSAPAATPQAGGTEKKAETLIAGMIFETKDKKLAKTSAFPAEEKKEEEK